MSLDFYRAFEDKHRGSRSLIKQRLEVYIPFITPLLQALPTNQAIDLGCGRGEWLELLAEQGFAVQGIDTDESMLAACRERDLKVEAADALAFIQKIPDQSLAVVSAFHLVEHVPFTILLSLVHEALRVLAPGGLLIMETPNPENLAVGACHFYLDPTHQRPIPPELLAFTTEFVGFKRTKLLRLQEAKSLTDGSPITLMSVLTGVSPDYAIVAQTNGDLASLASLDAAFATNYGLSLDDLALRFQDFVIESRGLAYEARTGAQQALVEAREARSNSERLHAHAESLNAYAEGLEARLNALLTSTSWKVTSPLRWLKMQWRRLNSDGLMSRIKALLKKLINMLDRQLQTRPIFRLRLVGWSKKLGLYRLLQASRMSPPPVGSGSILERSFEQLTPDAKELYAALKDATNTFRKTPH